MSYAKGWYHELDRPWLGDQVRFLKRCGLDMVAIYEVYKQWQMGKGVGFDAAVVGYNYGHPALGIPDRRWVNPKLADDGPVWTPPEFGVELLDLDTWSVSETD